MIKILQIVVGKFGRLSFDNFLTFLNNKLGKTDKNQKESMEIFRI